MRYATSLVLANLRGDAATPCDITNGRHTCGCSNFMKKMEQTVGKEGKKDKLLISGQFTDGPVMHIVVGKTSVRRTFSHSWESSEECEEIPDRLGLVALFFYREKMSFNTAAQLSGFVFVGCFWGCVGGGDQ